MKTQVTAQDVQTALEIAGWAEKYEVRDFGGCEMQLVPLFKVPAHYRSNMMLLIGANQVASAIGQLGLLTRLGGKHGDTVLIERTWEADTDHQAEYCPTCGQFHSHVVR